MNSYGRSETKAEESLNGGSAEARLIPILPDEHESETVSAMDIITWLAIPGAPLARA